jgi:hypothetical protein
MQARQHATATVYTQHAAHGGMVLVYCIEILVTFDKCCHRHATWQTPFSRTCAEYVLTEVHKAGFKEPTPIQVGYQIVGLADIFLSMFMLAQQHAHCVHPLQNRHKGGPWRCLGATSSALPRRALARRSRTCCPQWCTLMHSRTLVSQSAVVRNLRVIKCGSPRGCHCSICFGRLSLFT